MALSLTKGSFSKKVKRCFDIHFPQYIDQITNKHWCAAQHFLNGYSSCLDEVEEYPTNTNEKEALLIEQVVRYLGQILSQ